MHPLTTLIDHSHDRIATSPTLYMSRCISRQHFTYHQQTRMKRRRAHILYYRLLVCLRQQTRHRSFESIVPPHFYGEMAKTELGCAVLQEKGHFGEFASFIRRHGLETEDADLILRLKSTLWAVVSRHAAESDVFRRSLMVGKYWRRRWRLALLRRGGDHPCYP